MAEITKEELEQILAEHQKYHFTQGSDGAIANLSRANLSRANLSEADLRVAYLSRAYLSRANLSGANLSGANLSEADLSGANLRGANLNGANLSEADLSEANLIEADLREANLIGANLIGADLREANLNEANLIEADLRGANLRGADLRGAYLSGAYLRGADLRGAKINDRVFKRCLWLSLFMYPGEVPALVEAIKSGKIDGSQYEGKCAYLKGTTANTRSMNIDGIDHSVNDLSEVWFSMIREGDKPGDVSSGGYAAQKVLEWVEEWQTIYTSQR